MGKNKIKNLIYIIHNSLEIPNYRKSLLLPPLIVVCIGAVVMLIHIFYKFEISLLTIIVYFFSIFWLALWSGIILYSDYVRYKIKIVKINKYLKHNEK